KSARSVTVVMELQSRVHLGTVASSSLIWVSVSRLMLTAYHSHVTSSAERARQTPLHAVHERLGATMTSFAGWQMPLRYASETAEHLAVRRAAGLFDLSHMGEIAVAGAGEVHDALRGRRRRPGRPGGVPAGRGRVPGHRQRVQHGRGVRVGSRPGRG